MIALTGSFCTRQQVDGLVDLDGIARVVEPQDGAVVDTERAIRLGDAGKAGIAEIVLLGEHGDLPDRDAAHLHQIAHRGVGFLGIARTVVEDIAIRRIAAHDIAAGVGPEEQHPPLERERHRDRCGRRCRCCR